MSKIERDLRDIHEKYAESAAYAGHLELYTIVQAEDDDEQNLGGHLRILEVELSLRRSARNIAPSPVSVPAWGGGSRSAHLERVKLPDFDGKFDSWPFFKQEWSDLQRGQSTTYAIQLRQLREKLPKTAQELIRSLGPVNGGMKAAFEHLEMEYGDKDLNILTVQKTVRFPPDEGQGWSWQGGGIVP